MFELRAMTRPPLYHFFGYYGIQPWDRAESRLLCLEVAFQDRPPTPEDVATIGLVDCDSLSYSPIAETTAWNFQQGCMLHWLPTDPDRKIVFNAREDDGFVSVILDVETGDRTVMPRPVSAVSRDGRRAISLNFSRLHEKRPGYGYAGIPDPYGNERHPPDDGVYVLDLETGEYWLALSLEDIFGVSPKEARIRDRDMWFNHTLFNADGSRFVFLSRFDMGDLRRTAMFTSDLDGDDVRCLVDYGLVSHFDWLDKHEILAWANVQGRGDAYYMIDDRDASFSKVGEGELDQDGHCSFSPDGSWILTDKYPGRDNTRELLLFNLKEERLISLGKYYSDPKLVGDIRCDLHPRWSRRGEEICFDSTHEGKRQLYVMDVRDLNR
jgi:hypothetical protein